MNWENIILSKEDKIGLLKINRPKVLNALNSKTLDELKEAIDLVRDDEEIFVLIISGEGRAFVAGADIEEMKDMNSIEARSFAEKGLSLFRTIEEMEKPVIAAVNGFALGGGCELAMACDIRLASKKAKFGQPETGLGITPGFGGTQRLSRLVGPAKAKEIIFTGDMIDGEAALKIGLVNTLVEAEEVMEASLNMAKKIASKGQLAIKYSKTAINSSLDVDLDTGMKMERELFALCFSTQDQKEGMSAFLEKRQADFKLK